MKIIEPSVKLWRQGDNADAHVARCARICYRKEAGNDEKLIEHLLKVNHHSMFRHKSVFAFAGIDKDIKTAIFKYKECPYINFIIEDRIIYISTNGNFMLDLAKKTDYYSRCLYEFITSFSCTANEFENKKVANEIMRYTFCIDTQVSTSRELNRVSPNNISEQSTRYVYEDGTICRPHWLNGYCITQELMGKYHVYKDGKKDDDINHKVWNFITACDSSFNTYKYLVKAGLNRQDARGVLPFDTATRCAYTYTVKEWRAIIDLRYYGTTGKPHPNAKIIAGMIRDELIKLGYDFE